MVGGVESIVMVKAGQYDLASKPVVVSLTVHNAEYTPADSTSADVVMLHDGAREWPHDVVPFSPARATAMVALPRPATMMFEGHDVALRMGTEHVVVVVVDVVVAGQLAEVQTQLALLVVVQPAGADDTVAPVDPPL